MATAIARWPARRWRRRGPRRQALTRSIDIRHDTSSDRREVHRLPRPQDAGRPRPNAVPVMSPLLRFVECKPSPQKVRDPDGLRPTRRTGANTKDLVGGPFAGRARSSNPGYTLKRIFRQPLRTRSAAGLGFRSYPDTPARRLPAARSCHTVVRQIGQLARRARPAPDRRPPAELIRWIVSPGRRWRSTRRLGAAGRPS